MDDSDPWHWELDRVVQELCTDQRSWNLRSTSLKRPDPTLLEHNLSEQEITGSVLLMNVDDGVMKEELGIKVLGRRAFLHNAIAELRNKSAEYQQYMQSYHPEVQTYQMSSPVVQSYFPPSSSAPLGVLPVQPSLNEIISAAGALQSPAISSDDLPDANQINGQTSNRITTTSDEYLISGNKRLKLDAQDSTRVIDAQFDNNVDNLVNHSHHGNEPANDVDGTATSRAKPIEVEVNGKKRKRLAPTLLETPINPERNRDLPSEADYVIHNRPAHPLVTQPQANVDDETVQTIGLARNPISNENVFRQVEPVSADITSMDLNRNENVLSETEDIVQHGSQFIERGKAFMGDDGRMRLVPKLQQDANSSKPRQDAEKTSFVEDKVHVTGKPTPKSPQEKAKAAKAVEDYVAKGYLGPRKVPVDVIFFKGIDFGDEISIPSEISEHRTKPMRISSGRRHYVYSLTKYYLRSERREVVRDGQNFTAVLPYKRTLAPKFQKQSFTLYYSSSDGKAYARRENIALWPELEGSIQEDKTINEIGVSWNLTIPQVMKGIGSFDNWDPSSLEWWSSLPNDHVLPLYGESDEENEFDEATWREMEEEKGITLDRPVTKSKKPPISAEDINAAIDDGIATLVAKWKLKKLPKLNQKAFKLWQRSRNTQKFDILKLRKNLAHIVSRIAEIRTEMLKDGWTSKAQVLRNITNFEVSVFDREMLRWKIAILKASDRPEQPIKPPPTVKEVKLLTDEGEGESIGSDSDVSDSDDSLDDFIVADEPMAAEAEEELGLADGESSEEDDAISDTTSLPKLLQTSPITPFSAIPADSVLEDPDHPFEDSPGIAQSLGKHTPYSSGSIKHEGPTLPKLPVALQTAPEIIDLTMISSDDGPPTVNLITPKRKRPLIKLFNRSSPLRSSPARLSEIEEITHLDFDKSPALGGPAGILVGALCKQLSHLKRKRLLDFISDMESDDLWSGMTQAMTTFISQENDAEGLNQLELDLKGLDARTFDMLKMSLQLFEMFIDCKAYYFSNPLTAVVIYKLFKCEKEFPKFYDLCCELPKYFDRKPQDFPSTPQPTKKRKMVDDAEYQDGDAVDDDDFDDEEDSEPISSARRRRPAIVNPSSDEGGIQQVSQHSKRKKKIFEDTQARDLREQDRQRVAEQQERRKRLQANLAKSGHTGEVGKRIIINYAKSEEQGLVYVHPHIGQRIKKHQTEGIQFMWNQIVADENAMQGCLLAHTMGLGKTMQVITLLVAIAEASASKDPTVYSQVPESLRVSRTLVLCPPGLIDNWMDELLTWAPMDLLGEFRKVDSSIRPHNRLSEITGWYRDGGILVMGYEMFRGLINNKKRKSGKNPLDEEKHEQVSLELLEGPNIIIADEAHKLKNAASAVTLAAAQFKSTRRIALTGSPLANNVEEYHTMIDWVAPNYLGPIREFRAKYVEPIQSGLWQDSTSYERRRSLKMLGVLKKDIAPKVNRADMSVLRNDLPPKKEFVITVPLTDLQKKAYSIYVQSMISGSGHSRTKDGEVTQATLWHWLAILSLLCNHPSCFDAKLRERKEEAKKEVASITDSTTSREGSELVEAIADSLNEPIWKVGVSQQLINDETDLFRAESVDMKSIELSNKVKILCQILDASKAVGDKVLVFSQSIQTLNFLEDLCKKQNRKYARLDGKTKMSSRQALTKDFNRGNTELYLISTTAGGLGLNLPGANRVVIFDFKFNPIMEEQAVGRAYRIGQKKPTFVYRFVAGGTFEDTVHNKTIFKMQLASRVVDKKNPIAYASKRISDFLFEPREVEQKDLAEFKDMDPKVLDHILASQSKGCTIRAIVQSDTFERDDEDKLTAEEEKEVQQLLSDSRLKRSNPNAWLQKQHEQLRYVAPVNPQMGVMNAGQHYQVPTMPINTSFGQTQGPILPPQRSQPNTPMTSNGYSPPSFPGTGLPISHLPQHPPSILGPKNTGNVTPPRTVKSPFSASFPSTPRPSAVPNAAASSNSTRQPSYTAPLDNGLLGRPSADTLSAIQPTVISHDRAPGNTKPSSVTEPARSPPTIHQTKRARSTTPVGGTINAARNSPVSTRSSLQDSKQEEATRIRNVIAHTLESAAKYSVEPSKLTTGGIRVLVTEIENALRLRNRGKRALKKASGVLLKDPVQRQKLLNLQMSPEEFVRKLLADENSPSSSVDVNDMRNVGIPPDSSSLVIPPFQANASDSNLMEFGDKDSKIPSGKSTSSEDGQQSAMFQAMSRKPVPSLKTPVSKQLQIPNIKTSRKRRAEDSRDLKRIVDNRRTRASTGQTSSETKKSSKIPTWAQKEIEDPKSSGHKRRGFY